MGVGTVAHQIHLGTHSCPTYVMTKLAFVAFLARPSLTECAKVFRIHTERNFLYQHGFPESSLLPTKFDASPPRPSVTLEGPLPAPSRGSCEIRRSWLAVSECRPFASGLLLTGDPIVPLVVSFLEGRAGG